MEKSISNYGAMDLLLKGHKLRTSGWDENCYIYLDGNGDLRDEGGNTIESGVIDYVTGIYRPKIQMWQWRTKWSKNDRWGVSINLYTEDDAKKTFSQCYKLEKHAGPFEVEE